jgi:predicted RNase H-like HicB family nuclease
MSEYLFPAVFKHHSDYFLIHFPDLEGCFSKGNSEYDAYRNAQEALSIYILSLERHKMNIPEPSKPKSIEHEDDECVVLICSNKEKYKKTKSVKKTLTIPDWLNEAAEARHFNFSSILQQALNDELNKDFSCTH